MKEKLQSCLNDNLYSIIEKENELKIYRKIKKMINQEHSIRIVMDNSSLFIYDVIRDDYKLKTIFQNEDECVMFTLLLIWRSFGDTLEKQGISMLRTLIKKKGEHVSAEEINHVFADFIDMKYFSIFKGKDNSICLFNENGQYKIKFKSNENSYTINHSSELDRGVIMTFNYAYMFAGFCQLFELNSKKLNVKTSFLWDNLQFLIP
jgi:hypothetical protein